jgi:hypothetical protein
MEKRAFAPQSSAGLDHRVHRRHGGGRRGAGVGPNDPLAAGSQPGNPVAGAAVDLHPDARRDPSDAPGTGLSRLCLRYKNVAGLRTSGLAWRGASLAAGGLAGANEVLGVNHNLAFAFSSGWLCRWDAVRW